MSGASDECYCAKYACVWGMCVCVCVCVACVCSVAYMYTSFFFFFSSFLAPLAPPLGGASLSAPSVPSVGLFTSSLSSTSGNRPLVLPSLGLSASSPSLSSCFSSSSSSPSYVHTGMRHRQTHKGGPRAAKASRPLSSSASLLSFVLLCYPL